VHIKIAVVALTLGVLLSASICLAAFDDKNARKLFEKKCTQCHGIQDYDMSNRSLKEWQLTVERMASYGVEEPYTEEEADKIVAFLYLGKHDPKPPGSMYGYEDPNATPAASQPATAPAVATVSILKPEFREARPKARSRAVLGVAKFMGYAATVVMALMVATGLMRKKFRANFGSIHMVLAIVLFGALSIHVSVYLAQYGAPNVLWLWFGILASILIGLVEFGGLMRRKLGANFIRAHSICGVVGLLLVVLHWAWTALTYQLPV
jgi:hypothetical protein